MDISGQSAPATKPRSGFSVASHGQSTWHECITIAFNGHWHQLNVSIWHECITITIDQGILGGLLSSKVVHILHSIPADQPLGPWCGLRFFGGSVLGSRKVTRLFCCQFLFVSGLSIILAGNVSSFWFGDVYRLCGSVIHSIDHLSGMTMQKLSINSIVSYCAAAHYLAWHHLTWHCMMSYKVSWNVTTYQISKG